HERERRHGQPAEDEERPRRPDGLRQRQERLRHRQVRHPVRRRRRAAAHAAVPQRVDLRVHDPRHRPHPRREGGDVQRQPRHRQPPRTAVEVGGLGGADGRGVGGGLVEHGGEEGEGEDDAGEADDEQLSPPGAVDEVDADEGAGGVEAGGDEGQRERRLVGGEPGELHDGGAVVHHRVDPHQLLEHL
ncbi:hypothetical protein EE612_037173, partial [Oryza sativa]